jgi:phage terminase large subunit
MNALLSRLRDRLLGRDPADVAAEAVYEAMCAPPAYVTLALACESAPDQASRAALLATVDDDTRAAAVAFMREPKSIRERERRLAWMRADRERRVPALLTYYSKHIPQWIAEWITTHDPRLKEKTIPFALFPRQVSMIEAMLESYRAQAPLSIVKARDSGASWVACCLLVALAIFEEGFTAIIGSQLEIKIDQSGTTGTLFHKIRLALESLPEEFRGGWTLKGGSANMRVWWPNGSTIQGEAGEAIGRGGRASIVCLDEYAHLMHPDAIDKALMATSDCKWYISSVNGTDNPFATRVREGKTRVFLYTWKDDPRKTDEWAAQKIAADGQRKFDQEYGCDFAAGNVDQMFPQAHLDAALDAHVKLGLEPTGRLYGALDVGNGGDPSAFCVVKGSVCIHMEVWPSSSNLVKEVRRAFTIADRFGLTEFCADTVGVGAGIEGIVGQLNAERTAPDERGRPKGTRITVHSFKGSEGPLRPEKPATPGSKVKAKDWYPNKKSQSYDNLRYRFALTYQVLQGDRDHNNSHHYISISSEIPAEARNQLMLELAQITAEESPGGKLQVDKYGDGASPNASDSLAMATAPRKMPMQISDETIAALGG